MNKRIIAVICLMLAAVFIFASCSKQKYKYYVDNEGKTHIAYTLSDGETLTDGHGGIVVVQTQKNGFQVYDDYGKPETEVFQEGISIDSTGKKIDFPTYSLTLPESWVILKEFTDYPHLRYGDEDGKTSLDIRISGEDLSAAVEDMREFHNEVKEKIDKTIEAKEETVTLQNGKITDVTEFTFKGLKAGDDGDAFIGYHFYIFRVKNATYYVSFQSSDEKEFKTVDFEEVISAINFK